MKTSKLFCVLKAWSLYFFLSEVAALIILRMYGPWREDRPRVLVPLIGEAVKRLLLTPLPPSTTAVVV
jgi:hypothetical protein